MSKRLLIDLYKCAECEQCMVGCDYFYRVNRAEHGVYTLHEIAAFMLTCRRCEEPSCVAACRFDALERQESGAMKRYNMRCVSCKSCSHACPFGVIYPEVISYYATGCDYCITKSNGTPACVVSCEKNALEYKEVEESEEDGIYILNEHLAVRAPKWAKENV